MTPLQQTPPSAKSVSAGEPHHANLRSCATGQHVSIDFFLKLKQWEADNLIAT